MSGEAWGGVEEAVSGAVSVSVAAGLGYEACTGSCCFDGGGVVGVEEGAFGGEVVEVDVCGGEVVGWVLGDGCGDDAGEGGVSGEEACGAGFDGEPFADALEVFVHDGGVPGWVAGVACDVVPVFKFGGEHEQGVVGGASAEGGGSGVEDSAVLGDVCAAVFGWVGVVLDPEVPADFWVGGGEEVEGWDVVDVPG